ncbi:MAG: phage tail tube protein [Clostridia bacterium]|nr:phage tail tube protein [Clostridia bacterium]
MNQNIMNALDSVAGSMASAYITLSDNTKYCFMQLYSFESNMEVNITEVPILGKTGKGNKPAGWTGTWKGTAHYNQSVIRKMLLDYKKTGTMQPFDIQVTNEDPTASVGRQTIVLKNCLTKGGILAKFDAGADILDEDIEGTFDDWEMPKQFSLLTGMQA